MWLGIHRKIILKLIMRMVGVDYKFTYLTGTTLNIVIHRKIVLTVVQSDSIRLRLLLLGDISRGFNRRETYLAIAGKFM